MKRKKSRSRIELVIQNEDKLDFDFLNDDPQRNREVLQEVIREVIESAKKSKLDTSIGVLLGKNYDELAIKVRRSNYIDCDNVACSDWGRYTICSMKGYRQCDSYSPSKEIPWLGITLGASGLKIRKANPKRK